MVLLSTEPIRTCWKRRFPLGASQGDRGEPIPQGRGGAAEAPALPDPAAGARCQAGTTAPAPGQLSEEERSGPRGGGEVLAPRHPLNVPPGEPQAPRAPGAPSRSRSRACCLLGLLRISFTTAKGQIKIWGSDHTPRAKPGEGRPSPALPPAPSLPRYLLSKAETSTEVCGACADISVTYPAIIAITLNIGHK